MPRDEITLAEAALELGQTRERVLRLIMSHRLIGRRTPAGRWMVETASLDEYKKHSAAAR